MDHSIASIYGIFTGSLCFIKQGGANKAILSNSGIYGSQFVVAHLSYHKGNICPDPTSAYNPIMNELSGSKNKLLIRLSCKF